MLKSGMVKGRGKLPFILPVVLYNGARKWTAPLELADLIAAPPVELEQDRPHLQYLLIDEGAYSNEELDSIDTLAADIFAIENSQNGADVGEAVARMDRRLGPEQESLRRALVTWILHVVLATRRPHESVPEVQDMVELKTMMKERNWEEWWERKGRQEGRQEGESTVLLRLLTRRFGPLDEPTQQKVASAPPEALLEWADRVLSAQKLEDVLA